MLRNLFDGPGILIIVLLLVVLFGAKRLPDAARGIGRSLRIFKSEVKQMKDDDEPAPAAKRPTEPLEGRVVHERERIVEDRIVEDRVVDDRRATTPGEPPRRDA